VFVSDKTRVVTLELRLHSLTMSLLLCGNLPSDRNQACIFVQAEAVVPDKQPNNRAANILTPKLPPVGAGKAVPAFPSPSAKVSVNSGKGAPSAAQTSPADSPAAGSSQVFHIVLQLLSSNALHSGDHCTAEIVCYLVPALYQCAGHGERLASAHAYCYTTCPILTHA
jgi:hypothetical protein